MDQGFRPQQAASSAFDDDGECALFDQMKVNKFRLRLMQVRDSLRSRGVVGTMRRIGEKLGVLTPKKGTPAPRRADEVLGLEPGEWVAVKSADEIRETLDADERNRGLYFMPEMWKFCDQRFQVLKRMNRLKVESTGQIRQIKNTVLLDGTYCDGSSNGGCDAACHHLWREVWLRRVDATGADLAGAETASEGG